MSQPATVTAIKETVEVFCDLTAEEFSERAVAFAILQDRIEAMEEKKKAVAERYKNHIGGMLSRSHSMRRVVADRKEKREVLCTWYADWASNSMLLRRDDTNEVVRHRTMTADEMQQGFDFQRGPTDPAPGEVRKPEPRRLSAGERHAREEPTDEPGENDNDENPELDG